MDNAHGGESSTGAGASASNAGGGSGAADAGGDWRPKLVPGARGRIVNKIIETMQKRLPESVPVPVLLPQLRKIAERFEEKIFAMAISQADYLRKISLKMLSVENSNKLNTKENPQDAQVVQNQRPHHLASRGSTSQNGSSGAVDSKKEMCHINKNLKDQYLAGLGDLYEIYMQYGRDNSVPTQGPTQVSEDVNFKLILERSLDSVQISKKPSLEGSTPMYKREILSLINSEEWMPGKKLQQSAGQAPGTSSNAVRSADGTLSPERGNAKRLRRPLEDDTHS